MIKNNSAALSSKPLFNTIITNMKHQDPEMAHIIEQEAKCQNDNINLIASENYTYKSVMEAQGTVLTNKYAEGYPGRRYYGGCQYVDQAEELTNTRLKELFKCEYVNSQPLSGTAANIAVFLAFLKPGDTILSMSLQCGGHLTHGSKASMSGKWFNVCHYFVNKETMLVDYQEIESLAIEHKPKLIIAGFSAYPRMLDWKKFRAIADKVSAILMCDIAHIAGLIAGGWLESPIEYADVVTSTTHKTLRGPRGGMILAKDKTNEKILNSAVFPGSQGGPLMQVVAAKGITFKKALEPEFKEYTRQIIANAKAFGSALIERGVNILTGGTDCHLIVANLTSFEIDGLEARNSLEEAGIICSQNTIPFDPKGNMKTSGIRLGTPACTTRGFKEAEFVQVADWIVQILKAKQEKNEVKLKSKTQEIKQQATELCVRFPIYTAESA